jgi:hypothetical protein
MSEATKKRARAYPKPTLLTSPGQLVPLVVYAVPVLLVLNALARFALSLFTPYWDVLPHVFIALAGTMATFALHAFFLSVRGFFEKTSAEALRGALGDRAALEDEKNALLRAIKDIAFEREVGKLSQEEFERLDRSYRLRAKDVLMRLDADLEPYIERAERLLAEGGGPVIGAKPEPEAPKQPQKKKKAKKKAGRRACSSCGTSNAHDAVWCKSCGASVAPVPCPSCGAPNERDAKFCNKCAAKIEPREAEAEKGEPAPEEDAEAKPAAEAKEEA